MGERRSVVVVVVVTVRSSSGIFVVMKLFVLFFVYSIRWITTR